MSKRYSGKSFKDSSVMKKAKLSLKEKRKIKKDKSELSSEKILNVCIPISGLIDSIFFIEKSVFSKFSSKKLSKEE